MMALRRPFIFSAAGSDEKKICRRLLGLLVAVMIGMLIFKAHYTGVTYDESMTLRDYAKSLYEARHNYTSTNNHVLNSILVYFAQSWFGDYEQFIRIFPMLSGTLFLLSTAFIVMRLLRQPWLWIFGLILIVCVRPVFNYLLMARGYTYGLSAVSLYIGVVFYWMHRPLSFRRFWVPVVILAALNFIALAAMISSIFVMFALNAVFVLLFTPRIYTEKIRPVKSALIHGVLIAALSGLALYLFYRPILSDVLAVESNPYVSAIAEQWKGWSSFVPFIVRLLHERIFRPQRFGRLLAVFFYLAAGAALLLHVVRIIAALRNRQWRDYFEKQKYGLFVALTFCLYFLVLFLYTVVFRHSPGLLRNHIFMVPLYLLTVLWLLDQALHRIASPTLHRIVLLLLCGLVGLIGYHYRPHLRAISDGGMGMARPLLQRLKALNPETVWNISFSRKMQYHYMGFLYYHRFDYRFNINRTGETNVFICRPDEQPPGSLLLDYDYFLNLNDCTVILSGKLDTDKLVFEVKPKIKSGD